MGAFVKKWFHLVLIFVFAYLAGSLAGQAANQFSSAEESTINAVYEPSHKPVALTGNGFPIYSASADGNWGLSFPSPGQAPVGNTTNDYLKQFNACYMGDPGEKVIYLTFDAGYENGNTAKILDALKKHGVHAAFFVVGNYLETSPELVKQMVAEGHTVGNHTFHHPEMSKISDAASFEKELKDVETLYQKITGEELTRFYRPPQGKYNTQNLQMAGDLGYKTFFWKYLIKPFNIGILKASIANILTNRALLRSKYAEMELHNDSISINYSNTLDQQFLEAVKETITENLDNSGFNVESLCASQNMSRSSFYNKLKALTDQAPADYIRLIRLKRAAQLLSEGQYNISEISDMTGFNDVKYFREVFKKYYKISPSGYSKGEMKEEPTKP